MALGTAAAAFAVTVVAAGVDTAARSRPTAVASLSDPYLRWCVDTAWTDPAAALYGDVYDRTFVVLTSVPPSKVTADSVPGGSFWSEYRSAVEWQQMPAGLNHAELRAYVIAVANAAYYHGLYPSEFAANVKSHCLEQSERS
ncbi:hypothetical protein [Streptacidiphilus rugosus]|uniref:hypothetical protein n=1 Tax=Streptacidiphilus rugosus TaxID=405783 RepID=UPI0005613CC8|nr:hypothetical protein [Streptacidiphilus rugosus]